MGRSHFQWLAPGQQRLFSLAPFTLQPGGLELARGPRAQRGDSWVVVAAFDGEARVARLRGSPGMAARAAQDLAEATGDSVVLGQPVGLDAGGLPVFKSWARVVTAKADPYSPEAFEAWATRMVNGMLRVSRSDLRAMATEALDHLSIPFETASGEVLEAALSGYRTTIANPTNRMANMQQVEISKVLERVIAASGAAATKIPEVRAALGAMFELHDERAAKLLARHHGFWVRDRHGAISQEMSGKARDIISEGLRQGLGQVEIGRDLSRMTYSGVRQPHYYRTVAANNVARARSYSLGTTLRAAGIQFYRIEAVLDARTTHQCEYLHQKVLPVGAGISNIERTMADPNPAAVLANQPFIKDEGDKLTVPTPGGGTAVVARIDSRGRHSTPQGPGGSYTRVMSQSDMVSSAIGFPPYHHNCRTTVVPA